MMAADPIQHEVRLRGLYAITRDECDTALLIGEVDAALQGGARIVQYRNKAATSSLAKKQALALREITRSARALLIINDDIELALAVGSDGVHLGREDFVDTGGDIFNAIRQHAKQTQATRIDGAIAGHFLIGISCYNEIGRARAAVTGGADYLAFGSVFPSSTKPLANRAGVDLIRQAKKSFSRPVVAIGGITLENAPQLIEAGVDAVAVISSLFDGGDNNNIRLRAQRFSSLFP